MGRRLLLASVAAIVGLACAAAARAAALRATGPPPVDARAYVVANAATGETIAAQNANEEVPMASLTKLMTVIVALQHLSPDQIVTVAKPAAKVGESTIYLRAGERISVLDLLKGALIQSANDAADALADAAADGNSATFIGWMNAEARQLGLRHTHFVRADGLDAPGHYSTAADLLHLAEVAMHKPIVRQIVREQTDTIAGGRVLHTWNDLLGVFPGLIGVKTGHTDKAGWCEVGAAQRAGYTIYAVVLGSPTRSERNAALATLLRWGIGRYRTEPVVGAGSAYAFAAVGWGQRPLALVPTRKLVRPFRVDQPVVAHVVAPGSVPLPVRRGQRLGRIDIWQGTRLLGTRPLVASRSVTRPGLVGRVAFYARRTLHHVLDFFS